MRAVLRADKLHQDLLCPLRSSYYQPVKEPCGRAVKTSVCRVLYLSEDLIFNEFSVVITKLIGLGAEKPGLAVSYRILHVISVSCGIIRAFYGLKDFIYQGLAEPSDPCKTVSYTGLLELKLCFI